MESSEQNKSREGVNRFFSLGDESMKIMAKNGESVNRKVVYPPTPEIDKVKLLDMEDFDTKGFAETKKEYQKIFYAVDCVAPRYHNL
jgi:hypothetical protein